MYNDTHANRKDHHRGQQVTSALATHCHLTHAVTDQIIEKISDEDSRSAWVSYLTSNPGLNISHVQYENKYLAIKWFSNDSLNNKSACWVALFCYLQYASVHWNVFRHKRGWKLYMLAWSTCMLWWLWSVRLYFTIWSMCLRLWIRLRYY